MKKTNTEVAKKTYSGVCHFCKQRVMFQLLEDRELSEEEENALATKNCTCEKAKKEQDILVRIDVARDSIEAYTSNMKEEEAGKLLLEAVEAIARHKIKKMQVVTNRNVSYTLTLNKDNIITAERKETICDEVTG